MEYRNDIKRTIRVSIHKNTEPTAFTHILEFKDKILRSMFTNGNWVNVYPTDLPFIDFDLPVLAYNNEKEKLPVIQKHGTVMLSTHTKYLYFHLHKRFSDKEVEEFIKEHEFKV